LLSDKNKRDLDFAKTGIEARSKGLILTPKSEGGYDIQRDPGFIDQDKIYKDLQIQKAKQDLKEVGANGQGKQLPPAQVLAVNEGVALPQGLKDIRATIEQNKDAFGPVKGFLSSMNPYDEKTKTMDSQLRTSAQAFGRFMEGGVLRKEDEDKYRKMFPELGDTPEVAQNKLDIVERKLIQKLQSDEKALKGSGYSTAGFSESIRGLVAPNVPGILAGAPPKNKTSTAKASSKIGEKKSYGGKNYELRADGWHEVK
jgi:hypothetical protein